MKLTRLECKTKKPESPPVKVRQLRIPLAKLDLTLKAKITPKILKGRTNEWEMGCSTQEVPNLSTQTYESKD